MASADQKSMEKGGLWIGRPLPRFEDLRLLRGAGRYTDDINLAGQAYLAMVRSRYAHGIIRKIDRDAARALAQDCDVWLFDEPTAFLDVKNQVDCLRSLDAMVKGGLAALAVLLSWQRTAQSAGIALDIAGAPEALSNLAALYGVESLLATVPASAEHHHARH